MPSDVLNAGLGLSVVDLRLLDRAEELRGRDSPLVRRAHAVPPELLPARTNATQPAGEAATAAREREPGGRRGAGEGGEVCSVCTELSGSIASLATETNLTLIFCVRRLQ